MNLTVSDNKGAKDHYFYEITIIYVFRGPGILGHVYDLDTNKPLSDVRIRLWSYDSYYYNSTETDENGYYEIHTPDEELELSIDLYDYYYYEIDITVGEDEVVEEDIYLERYPPENAMVYGYVYDAETNDPIYDADVDMEDDDAYFNYTWTDFAGYYELNAPAGTFILYCYYTDYSNDIYYESHRSEIILKENQKIQHDIYLDIRIPTEANITFDFTSWDYISLKQTDIIYSSTESIREDLDANEDGQVSEAEVTAYETEMEVDYDEMYSLFFSTEDFILVDFIHYNYAYGSMDIELEDATGPTDSDEPITLIMEFGCESDSMIPISDTHDFDFIIYYDDPGYHYEFYVILPILYECNNYTAVENVNVTGTNPVYIDPLEEPPSYNGYDDVWMEMEIEMS